MNAMKAKTVLTFMSSVPGTAPAAGKTLYTCWMNEARRREQYTHTFWQINLIQGREHFPVLTPLILCFSAVPFPQTTVAVLFVHESACWSIFLLPEISRSYFLNLSPEACMLATLANTIPHVTKHQCYFLLHLLLILHPTSLPNIFCLLPDLSHPSPPTANAFNPDSHYLFPGLESNIPPNQPTFCLLLILSII